LSSATLALGGAKVNPRQKVVVAVWIVAVALVSFVFTPWTVTEHTKEAPVIGARVIEKSSSVTQPFWDPPHIRDDVDVRPDLARLGIIVGVATLVAGGLVLLFQDSPSTSD
jgi:hypothetical protein